MRQTKFLDIISLSFNQMVTMLFKPFNLKKWLRLYLIAFLAGAAVIGGGGGGSNNIELPLNVQNANDQKNIDKTNLNIENESPSLTSNEIESVDENQDLSELQRDLAGDGGLSNISSFSDLMSVLKPYIWGIVILLTLLTLLFTWLASRFQFIWYRAVSLNSTLIAKPFKDFERLGNSYLKFLIGFVLTGWLFLAGLGWWIYVLFSSGSIAFEEPQSWAFLIFPVTIFIFLFIILSFASFLGQDFAVPIMAQDNSTFSNAFTKLWKAVIENKKDFVLYLLISWVISIFSSIIAAIIALIFAIPLLILALLMFGIPYLLLKLSMPFFIYALLIGIPFSIVAVIILLITGLPIIVFNRLFSLNFLYSLDCGYKPLNPGDSPGNEAS